MRKIAAVLLAVLALGACDPGDNDTIRAKADDTFRYTHWTQHTNTKGMDSAELHFINESTHREMTWKGDVRDAMIYLEQIDKGKCYKRPVDKWEAREVPCE